MAPSNIFVTLFVLFCCSSVYCDDDALANAASAAVPPPPIGPGVPGGFGGFFPGAGAGAGFHKSIDFNAGGGFGPFLGGGFGGVPPPVPIEGEVDPGVFGGSPFGQFVGPSYIPSTWLGSILSAKGDLLFPIVLFVFFVVGVWWVISFLLGLIVPLIAAKFAVLEGVTGGPRPLRSAEDEKNEQVNSLTNSVMAAFENVGCMKMMACHTGNFVNLIAGEDKVNQYESALDTMKAMDPEMVEIFKSAAKSGKVDCNQKYSCKNSEEEKQKQPHPNENSI